MTRVVLAFTIFVLVLSATGAAHASDARPREISVRLSAVEPASLTVALHERVVFVNRSGRAIHVEFAGPNGEHHVAPVPGAIAAEFHRPGRHPFVVHFYAGASTVELHGFVDVEHGPAFVRSPECGGFTIEETCIER